MKFLPFIATLIISSMSVVSTARAFTVPVVQNAFHQSSGSGMPWRSRSSSQLHQSNPLLNFINDAKKKLAQKSAGDYDKEAVKAELMGLIDNNSVLFLSFLK